MLDLLVQVLLDTESLALRNIVCECSHRHKSAEESTGTTCLVFPYRGVFTRHVGRNETFADANQVLFFNQAESYRISHPVEGGDACLSLAISDSWLSELAPKEQIRAGTGITFHRQRRRIDPHAQALVAMLRHGLTHRAAESLEAESLVLTLVRMSLGERTSHGTRATAGRQRLVDRAKVVLSSDLGRRWSLTEVATEVGVSPVYLTQVFQQVEAVPLYRYQLRMRLARALDLLDQYDDLAALGLELGFSSHSHFSSAFRQAFGRTPAEFQRAVHLR